MGCAAPARFIKTEERTDLEDYDAKIPIVSKIEKPGAWTNFDAILEESDGVMIARGDLGVELALERVPSIQKSIIRRARRLGKFVITAAQMLESMTDRPYPTRAEVSDVANAIYDGTDAVMLSGETAAGKYPLEAARMIERIATEAEMSVHFRELPQRENRTHADVVADAAYRAAQAVNAEAIVVFTAMGSTGAVGVALSSPRADLRVHTEGHDRPPIAGELWHSRSHCAGYMLHGRDAPAVGSHSGAEWLFEERRHRGVCRGPADRPSGDHEPDEIAPGR